MGVTKTSPAIASENGFRIRGHVLARNTVLNFAGQVAPLAVGIVTIPYVVHHLGVDRFGILAFAWIVVGYLGLFDLGLSQATTKFVAELLGKGEMSNVPQMLWTATIAQLLLGTVAGVLMAAASPILAKRVLKMSPELMGETEVILIILAVSLPLVFASGAPRGALAAAQRFDLLNALGVPSSCLAYLIPVGVIAFGYGLRMIVLFLVVARIVAALTSLALCVHVIPGLRRGPYFRRGLLRPLLS